MKAFSQLVTEVLNPEQKSKVDTWDTPHHSFSDHMFENPTDQRAYFELENPNENTETRTRISEHLKKHDIDIDDYVGGKGRDRFGRPVNIGKALKNTGAPLDMISSFENDGARQQKGKDLILAISRHPHDVAGMTSGGQSWENESCMNFSSGLERHYLKKDVQHGTHIAYLINRDDKEIQKPLARIALKPFENADDESERILRPEHRVYGNAPDSFTHTVNRVLSRHFPGDGYIYTKHPHLYDDDKNSMFVTDVKEGLNSPDWEIRKGAITNPTATSKDVEKALRDQDYNVKSQALKHSQVTEKQVTDIIQGKYGPDGSGQSDYDERTFYHIAIQHHKMPVEVLGNILTGKIKGVSTQHMMSAAANPKLTKEHLDYALDHPEEDVQAKAAANPSLSKEQLSKALGKDKALSVRYAALRNRKITPKHLTELLDSTTPRDKVLQHAAYHHARRTNEHIMRGLSSSDPSIREAVLERGHGINPDHIEIGLADKEYNVRAAAASNKGASHEQIERAFSDVSIAAMQNPNATHDQISRGLEHKNIGVRLAAAKHLNATPEHIDRALEISNEPGNIAVGEAAIHNQNADIHNIHAALGHHSNIIRSAAIRHPNATAEHARRAVNDAHMGVRNQARWMLGR
jgi:hypothetical protein